MATKKKCNKPIFIVFGLKYNISDIWTESEDRFEYKYIEVESQIASDDKPYKKEYQKNSGYSKCWRELPFLIQTGLDIGLQ